MKIIKTNKLSSSNIKKGLKAYGINVLSCRQNKTGVIVVVSSEHINKTIKFFNEFEIYKKGKIKPTEVVSNFCGRADFGTLYSYND